MHFDASVLLEARGGVFQKRVSPSFKVIIFLPFFEKLIFLASLMEEKVQQNNAIELYGDYFTEVVFFQKYLKSYSLFYDLFYGS